MRYVDRILESYHGDDVRLLDKGTDTAKLERRENRRARTVFALTAVTGITMVLRLENLSDDISLDVYAGIKEQIEARNIDVPIFDLLPPPSSPVTYSVTLIDLHHSLSKSGLESTIRLP